MPRYRLRTLLILLAILPPMLGIGYVRWQRYQERQRLLEIVRTWDVGITIDWQAIRRLSAPPPPPADDSNMDQPDEK